MRIIIDRVEESFAVVEMPDGSTVSCPIALFPGGKEGMVFDIARNEEEEGERQERIQSLFDRLKKKSP